MMTEDICKKYKPFNDWTTEKELGKGGSGRVFKIYKDNDLGGRTVSALKLIHIPSEKALAEQKEIQPTMEDVRKYFQRQVERVKGEIRILQKCKGHSHIVSYEDHYIVENAGDDEFGWDILIRMELLHPLKPFFCRETSTQYDVIKMWLDIADALVYCEEQNIIHRDIKPANILLADSGNYKLCDFGVSKKIDMGSMASTHIGTPKYMAPELAKHKRYDKRVDYYSLALVVYFYLNKNRFPFYPPFPAAVSDEEMKKGDERRKDGEKIPPIKGVPKQVNQILLKCLSPNPEDRYSSAKELYNVLSRVLISQEETLKKKYLNKAEDDTSLTKTTLIRWPKKSSSGKQGTQEKSSVSVKLALGIAALFLVAGTGGVIYGISQKNTPDSKMVSSVSKAKPVQEQKDTDTSALKSKDTDTPVPKPETTDTPTPEAEPTDTPTPEPKPSDTPTPTPEPTKAPKATATNTVLGKLERPQDGSSIEGTLKLKGWILTSDKAEDIEPYINFKQKDTTVVSYKLSPEASGSKTLESRQKKYENQITATQSYDLKASQELTSVPKGSYTLELCIQDPKSKKEEVLDSIMVSVDSDQSDQSGNVMDLMGLDTESHNQVTHYLNETDGLAFGIDIDEKDPSLKANADQVILTGWINAEKGTSIGMYFDIDNEVYTADTLTEKGGSVEITRAPRNLSKIDKSLIGGSAKDTSEAGYVAELKLPFLEAGEHTLSVSFNITPTGGEPEIVDIVPISLTVDPSESVKEKAVDNVISKWAKELPSQVLTPTSAPDSTKGNQTQQ